MMAPRKRKFPPIYEHSLQDAAGRGELDQFYASQELNIECAKAITAALSEHYNCSTYCLGFPVPVKSGRTPSPPFQKKVWADTVLSTAIPV